MGLGVAALLEVEEVEVRRVLGRPVLDTAEDVLAGVELFVKVFFGFAIVLPFHVDGFR